MAGRLCRKLMIYPMLKLKTYSRLKQQQDQRLGLAGAILAMSVLAATLLIKAHNANSPFKFSEYYVFLHAGIFTLGLAIAFLVARRELNTSSQLLELELARDKPGADAGLEQWLDHDERLQRIALQLKTDSWATLKELVSVLAPLISAVMPLLFSGAPS